MPDRTTAATFEYHEATKHSEQSVRASRHAGGEILFRARAETLDHCVRLAPEEPWKLNRGDEFLTKSLPVPLPFSMLISSGSI